MRRRFGEVETLSQILFADIACGYAVVKVDVALNVEVPLQSCYSACALRKTLFAQELVEYLLALLAAVFLLVAEIVFDVLFGALGLCLFEPIL